jgi:transcriptional regulator with XRE-family HTH domain
MELNERILLILKDAGKKRVDLARALNISEASVSTMCSGKTNPSAQNIALICQKFGINEEWLKTGKGEMKAPLTKQAEIAEITAQLFHKEETDPETYNFLIELNKYLLQLDETQMQAVLDMIRKLNAAISKGDK